MVSPPMKGHTLIVASKVKDAVKDAELRMDSSFPDALTEKVNALIADAAERAKANGRSTVRPHDLA